MRDKLITQTTKRRI